jgi:predicted phosphodiesterase
MLAILYDIHGNRPALEAVIEDARSLGADRWLLGGDYAAFGAWPVETVELLRAELGPDAIWLRGNWERWHVEADAVPDGAVPQGAATFVRDALGDALIADLYALPTSTILDDTLYVHASPRSDLDWISPEPSEDDDQLLSDVTQDRLVFGHTHVQFARRSASGIEMINPGSVGLPWDDDPRAAYATLDDDGTLDLHRVEYDVAGAATAIEALGGEWSAVTAERLRSARF